MVSQLRNNTHVMLKLSTKRLGKVHPIHRVARHMGQSENDHIESQEMARQSHQPHGSTKSRMQVADLVVGHPVHHRSPNRAVGI